jgi:hypothetical protein
MRRSPAFRTECRRILRVVLVRGQMRGLRLEVMGGNEMRAGKVRAA